jgi:CDP-diglyceride synthetase
MFKILKRYQWWFVGVALVIIIVISVRPMYWLGSIGYIWVMVLLVIAVGMLATYAWIAHNTKSFFKSFLATLIFLLFIAAVSGGGYILYNSKPELKAWEVKVMANQYFSNGRASSVQYLGNGIWEVRVIYKIGVVNYYYNENSYTFKLKEENN